MRRRDLRDLRASVDALATEVDALATGLNGRIDGLHVRLDALIDGMVRLERQLSEHRHTN